MACLVQTCFNKETPRTFFQAYAILYSRVTLNGWEARGGEYNSQCNEKEFVNPTAVETAPFKQTVVSVSE